MSYNNPIPVAVAMIFNSDFSKVLVGKRSIEPRVGGDALIGGYTDKGETPEMAIRREVGEETGRQIGAAVLHYELSAITPDNRMLMFFSTSVPDVLFDGVQDSSEMHNIRFISPDDLESAPLCFPLHHHALQMAWRHHRPDLFQNSTLSYS